ncbi:MAG: DUF309 domain-containing protein [Deltaproteobacteria bacterium]|nr:DUF309 domain-containing protein [Deltaproteobacteria bacterium]
MTRAQRNALADVIVAALHERAAGDALATLERVLATTDAVAVERAAVARLVATRIVVVGSAAAGDGGTQDAGDADATCGPDAAVVHVVLALAFVPVRAEALARVQRARLASKAYWRTPAPGERGHRSARPELGGTRVTNAQDGAEADLGACLRRAAALFDARLYFEVHEELEALWRRVSGATRIVVQGLLQIAVALHHAEGGNVDGARRLLAAGRAKVEPYAPTWRGVAIAALLADLRRWEHAHLDRGEPAAAPRLVIA